MQSHAEQGQAASPAESSKCAETPAISPALSLPILWLGVTLGTAWHLSLAELWTVWGYTVLGLGVGLLGLMVLLPTQLPLNRIKWRPVFAQRLFAWLADQKRLKNMKNIGYWVLVAAGTALMVFALQGFRAAQRDASRLSPELEGADVQLVGVVASLPQRLSGFEAGGVRFRLEVEHSAAKLPSTVQLSWYGPGHERLRVGQRWQFTARLRAPHGSANPRGFDYELWLWQQGIQAVGYVRVGRDSRSEDAAPEHAELSRSTQAAATPPPKAQKSAPQLLGQTAAYPFERWREALRGRLERYIERYSGSYAETHAKRSEAAWAHSPGDPKAVALSLSSGIIAALALGDQAAIDRADWDVFRATGVAHLMSISGLHITLFAWLAIAAAGWGWRRSVALCHLLPAHLAAAWLGALAALGYALLSGWGLPAQRTVLMLCVMLLLRHVGKLWPWYWVWMMAFCVIALFDPWALLHAGFWLSFVAVGILFASTPQGARPAAEHEPQTTAQDTGEAAKGGIEGSIEGEIGGDIQDDIQDDIQAAPTDAKKPFLAKLRRFAGVASAKLWALLREQTLITLALAPLSALLFGQISVIGLLSNIVAIPLVTLLITPLALLGLLLPPLWHGAAWLIVQLMQGLEALASLSWAVWHTGQPPGWLGALAVAAGVLLVVVGRWVLPARLRQTAENTKSTNTAVSQDIQASERGIDTQGYTSHPNNPKRTLTLWAFRSVCLLPIAAALMWQHPRPAAGQFELLALDVGQGTAVLVRTAHHSVLYDTGPKYTDHANAGERIVLPLLRSFQEPLSHVVLSHRDSDHIGGAAAVLNAYPNASVLHSMNAAEWAELIEADLKTPQRPNANCLAGKDWQLDGVRFEFLHPSADDYAANLKSNGRSCVLKVQAANGQSALLTGDIEATQELALLDRTQDTDLLRSSLLLAPHHGSNTSSTLAFLQAVQPQAVWVQAGYLNRYGHPGPAVVTRYRAQNIPLVSTPSCGAMMWQSWHSVVSTRCQRHVQRRYWSGRFNH